MKRHVRPLLWLLLAAVLLTGAISCKQKPASSTDESQALQRPDFAADSAFSYIQQQVDFGPRVPGTPAHRQCADWLVATLQRFGWETMIQEAKVTVYSGKEVPCLNIIGSINPEAQTRLLLCAHWDTRPFADQHAPDRYTQFDGADDGGSGVGVLLEIARQLKLNRPEIGVDIIFFDVEDWGEHVDEKTTNRDWYCLGSQYWGRNLHKPGYTADNGILLDIVGARGATFGLEGTSMRFAPDFMRRVWDIANQLGHGNYFIYQELPAITDDHLYVNQLTGIPTIDIINHSFATPTGFPPHWHTPADNMTIIDKGTLQAVGETVLSVINTYP